MIQPIQLKHQYDFGHSIILTLFNYKKKFCLFQMSLSFDDYGGGPYCQITFGLNHLFGFFLSVWRFSIDFQFFARSW